MVAATYGTLRAGQPCIPLDPDRSAERQHVVLEDIGAPALVHIEGIEITCVCPTKLLVCFSALSDPNATLPNQQ